MQSNLRAVFFPSVLSHCWLGDRKGIRPVNKVGCWFVGDDDLTGALHILQLQLSSLPPSSLAQIESRMKTFAYRLTHVLEKYPLKQRERERERERILCSVSRDARANCFFEFCCTLLVLRRSLLFGSYRFLLRISIAIKCIVIIFISMEWNME